MTADRALLLAYSEWLVDEGCLLRPEPSVDAFLATYAQPEVRIPINLGRRDGEDAPPTPPCRHGSQPGECVECDGGSSGKMESKYPALTEARVRCGVESCADAKPPAPPAERFWFLYGGSGGIPWRAYETDQTGGHIHDLSPVEGRPTRELAEADGMASGLPEWRGGR
jgi:hypothetical protein